MALNRVGVFINMHGDPSVGIFSITDRIELWWDLDNPDMSERQRVREILERAWSELYDDKATARFDDECPDCLKLKVNCICIFPKEADDQ